MTMFDKDVLTTGEVAKICNVAARTVSKWFDSGQLEGYRIPGSKDRRIPVANLQQFMKSHGIPLDGLMTGATRVLICDGDEAVCQTLCDVLSDESNCDVRTAKSMFDFGVQCERFRPHVVLVDTSQPAFDANSLMESIRSNEELTHCKVVAMSGTATDGQTMSLTRMGFDASLRKPFTVRQALECVQTAASVI